MSAYNEIEFRFRENGKSAGLPLKSRLGSKLRVKEFIMFLLASGGSRASLLGIYDSDMMHIMPQVGSIFLAEGKERSLNLYRFEDFDNEIERLASDSGFSELIEIKTFAPRIEHESSRYSMSLTSAASSFLYNSSRLLISQC